MINQNLLLTGDDGYNLTNSLRFRSSASAYLNRTPASAGNRKTWTWSGWVKRGTLGVSQYFFSGGTGGSDTTQFGINFLADNKLNWLGGSGTQYRTTTQVFRDPSAWYHIVLAFDTTLATANDRIKIYVNGTQITAFDNLTNPTQNVDYGVNQAEAHNIGRWTGASGYFDGYMTEVNFIDGQALTPSSFGETSSTTGVWIPKKYTGTYGTNGFYLPFTDNSALTTSSNVGLGKDFSGNANYWTTNNISITSGSTYDSMTDVPTLTSATVANYAVLNPIYKNFSQPTFSDGNLSISSNTANYQNSFATIPVTSGKWYCELTLSGNPSSALYWGISNAAQVNYLTGTANNIGVTTGVGYAYVPANGDKYSNGTQSAYGNSLASGDILGIALDLDSGKIWWSKNGVFQASGDPVAGTNAAFTGIASDTWFIGGDVYTHPTLGANTMIANFGQRPFAYTPPTGFLALNTFNLPTPTIGATASSQANKYMDVLTWTGTGTTTRSQTSLNFQPDFVWAKSRSLAIGHTLYDAVRGAGASKALFSNSTEAEGGTSGSTASSEFGYISSLDSNGFSTSSGSVNGNYVNSTSNTYVAWNWKANGSGSSNTAGSITSTVSANTTAGFSVVTWTGTNSNATVGHGLGVAPSMIILKPRNASDNWPVWHSSFAVNEYVYLNLTNAKTSLSTFMNSTLPSSTVISLGTWANVNTNTQTMVAYCFTPIAGYSAFGSYTGNGSTDGTFVFTGFRPRFLIVKRTNDIGSWIMTDSARSTYNVTGELFNANTSGAEFTTSDIKFDYLSNGFKLREVNGAINASGSTYIYMAFAESPFKYANAR